MPDHRTASPSASGVKATLRPKRRRERVETESYLAFIRRAIRAHGVRVATGDVEDLAGLLALRDDLDEAIAVAVAGLRAEPQSCSWQAIADAAGITRQAAAQRWAQARGARRPGGQPAHLR